MAVVWWMGVDVMMGRAVVVGWFFLRFFLFLSIANAGGRSPVINEVLYDPGGSDAGHEFVELYNPDSVAVCLDGWYLETGNGAYENRWTTEWTGSRVDTIGPHAFFLIGEESVLPVPDVVTSLDLQNGPDGCRIVKPGGGSDVVGWGDLVFEAYFEGSPVPKGGSGTSIGRDPDGVDSDVNAADFERFDMPTPADYNHPPVDLAMAGLSLSRHTPAVSARIDLVARLLNRGIEACGVGGMVTVETAGTRDSVLVGRDLEPGGEAVVVLRLSNPGPGIHEVTGWHSLSLDRWTGNDTARTSIVVPPPPLVINEIMFSPGGKDCEWIELLNRTQAEIDLAGWTLEDSRGTPGSIAAGDLILPGGGFFVLVQDAKTFGTIHADLARDVYGEPRGGWPTLNDVDGPLGYADAVVLRDPFGTAVDSVAYAKSWTSPGKSVERIDPAGISTNPANWSPHFGETASSAAGPNSVSFLLPVEGRVLTLSPRTFSPDGDGEDDMVAVSVALPGAGLVRLSVFDLNGRMIRRLIDGEIVDTGRVTFWDGTRDDDTACPMGVYLLLFESRMEASGRSFSAKSPVVLIRR
jgi:hypothetical protein